MTTSASTPRLRLTLAFYLGLWLVTAIAGPPMAGPPTAGSIAGPATDLLAWLIVIGGSLGRIWCSVFVAGRKDAVLVTEGPYALCRHPLYALSICVAAGLGLGTGSLVLTVLAVLVVWALVSQAARSEERLLLSLHDTAYADYMTRARRFLPRFAALPDAVPPQRLEIQPRVLWKAFLDAGSIVLLLALIIGTRLVREAGITPTLLPLP
jgi:protein-S-isoprenylcysteine O-methyltransferase Ste14